MRMLIPLGMQNGNANGNWSVGVNVSANAIVHLI